MPPNVTAAGKGKTPTKATVPPKENPLFLTSGLDDEDSDDDGAISDHDEEPIRTEIAPDAAKPVVVGSGLTINVSDDDSSEEGDEDHGATRDRYASGDDEDDDPVVCSYDIHITDSQAPDLYIFQYPVRSRNKPYTKAENACPLEARLKPKSGLVEVDVPVNVHVNYDEEKGRAWGDVLRKAAKEAGRNQLAGSAGGVAGNKRRKVARGDDDEEEEEEPDVMRMEFADAIKAGRVLNKQTLGSKMQPDNTKYMVGVFKNGIIFHDFFSPTYCLTNSTFRSITPNSHNLNPSATSPIPSRRHSPRGRARSIKSTPRSLCSPQTTRSPCRPPLRQEF